MKLDALKNLTSIDIDACVALTPGCFRCGAFFVKIFRSVPHATNAFAALDFLAGRFNTPRAIEFLKIENEAALVSEWIDGEAVTDFEEMGATVACFHQLDARKSRLRFTSDPLTLKDRLISGCEQNQTAMDFLHKFGQFPADRVVVHRDLVRRNVRQNSAGQISIIDWEFAASAPSAWDFVKPRRFDKDDYRSFCAGYKRVRDVPTEESIRTFEVYEWATDPDGVPAPDWM